MKTYFTLFTVLFTLIVGFQANAQRIGDLNGINYQAVAIDEDGKEIVGMDIDGKPLYEKEISVRFTIQKGQDGEVQYQETHTTLTDQYGLFSVVIGHGEQSGSGAYSDLLSIPWIDADQWLKVELSIENNNDYRVVSLQQFMTVPYAFYTDDIADDAITTEKILNEEILNEDVSAGAIDSRTILDETILAEDIATGAVTTSEILDETILAKDIATGAVETSEILDETILAEDIAAGAVTTSEILDETILAEDIATGAVDSRVILNETILSEDIQDGTIINNDIADSTINLQSKVTDTLQVENGGTGIDASTVTDGQLLIGDGTNKNFQLSNITAGEGIEITNSAGGITIASPPVSTQTSSDGSFEIPVGSSGTITAGQAWYSPNSLKVSPPADKPFEMGDIFLASANVDLKGCILSVYLESIDGDGKANVQVVLFNPQNTNVTLQTPVTFKFLLVK